MKKIVAVILAAGRGARMAGSGQVERDLGLPKVMLEAHGKPLIGYCVDNLRRAGMEDIVVVVGYKQEKVMEYLDGEVEYATQKEQLGTGHAAMMAQEKVDGRAQAVLICYGDMPLFRVETIQKLVDFYNKQKPTIAMLSVEFEDPTFWAYGRIIRDDAGEVEGIVEQKDCSPEQLEIKESNPGFYIFENDWLWKNVGKLKTENAQKEFYLTDLIGLAKSEGERVAAMKVSEENEALGVNTPEQLKQAEAIIKERAEEYVHI